MILPNHEQCRAVMQEMDDFKELNDFEREFVTSNLQREEFTLRQRESIAEFADKYELENFP